ncbi:alanyl-tRNA editing protein Aarsd1 [Aethina tumida]|uniref:alanyl-tRNA editing protein Aarsd1 n=1 Tax=Aethina tumida TaxID=116153 RepID=UPI0021474A98|nr:alanyl-tRNA editing protein Aarsd1 [Aethina tumida]
MVFKCQEDSFLKEFVSKVVSCKETEICLNEGGKKVNKPGYEVILEDTIIFPEGGGQPSDHGFLNEIPVKQVIRREDIAIHLTESPLNVGDTVKQTIDWERRFDHMQQHSGQHLISAVLEKKYKHPTISWWLGEDVSYVELESTSIPPEEIKDAEKYLNKLIRDGLKVTVQVYGENISEEELKEARSVRGLPTDHKGDIRVINIDGVDTNMCCGTHVTNLSQLQVIKLLHTEKKKGRIILYFLVGNRVLNRLAASLDREQQITALLKGGPNEHVGLIDKLQKNVKTQSKNLQSVLKDMATFMANQLNETLPIPEYFIYHRSGAEPDFMNHFIRELDRTDIFLFLSVGDDKKDGNILLYGIEEDVQALGDKLSDILGGKGARKGNRYQAKVTKMANRSKAEDCVVNYFKPQS